MTEAHLLRAIELALGSLPGVLVLRNSCGVASFTHPETGRTRTARFGLGVGSPDLVLFLAPEGHALGLEVKTKDGRTSPEQERCHQAWARFGVPVFVVRSIEEAREALAYAQRRGQ
jgi:hypothetical protein